MIKLNSNEKEVHDEDLYGVDYLKGVTIFKEMRERMKEEREEINERLKINVTRFSYRGLACSLERIEWKCHVTRTHRVIIL